MKEKNEKIGGKKKRKGTKKKEKATESGFESAFSFQLNHQQSELRPKAELGKTNLLLFDVP